MTVVSHAAEEMMDPELVIRTVGDVSPAGYGVAADEPVPTPPDEQDQYFRRLVSTGVIPRSLADTALACWHDLQSAIPGLPVPAESARDGGPVNMHWRAGRHELSVEIPTNEPPSWTYRDRQTDEFEGDDFAVGSLPVRLADRLALLTRNPA